MCKCVVSILKKKKKYKKFPQIIVRCRFRTFLKTRNKTIPLLSTSVFRSTPGTAGREFSCRLNSICWWLCLCKYIIHPLHLNFKQSLGFNALFCFRTLRLYSNSIHQSMGSSFLCLGKKKNKHKTLPTCLKLIKTKEISATIWNVWYFLV